MDFFTLMQGHAAVFLLLLTRVSGIFIISPFFGSLNIPVYFRAAASLAFALVLFPVVDNFQSITAPATVLGYTEQYLVSSLWAGLLALWPMLLLRPSLWLVRLWICRRVLPL